MKSYTEKEIRNLLLKACRALNPRGKRRGGQKIWAERNGISQQYLGELLQGTKPLQEHIVRKIDEDLRRVEGWFLVPKQMRSRKAWTLEEFIASVNYEDN